MSTQLSGIDSKVVAVLSAERTGKLSEDLGEGVVVQGVSLGDYTLNHSSEKPLVRVAPGRIGYIRVLAGNLHHDVRLKYRITGAVEATAQEAAYAGASQLLANVLMVLGAHSSEPGYWSGAGPGWRYPVEEESGEDVVEYGMDVGSEKVIVHFRLYWSCNARLTQEAIE